MFLENLSFIFISQNHFFGQVQTINQTAGHLILSGNTSSPYCYQNLK